LFSSDEQHLVRTRKTGRPLWEAATMTVQAILGTKGFEVVSVPADATLADAVKILSERHIGAVLVMKDHHIEGILSERDIVRVLGQRGASVLSEPVSGVMTKKVVTCRRADHASTIMEKMTNGKFRHLPVVENERVVGLISIGDIVKWRVKEYEQEQEALRDYIKTA
jgi:CBS domain-containing protein